MRRLRVLLGLALIGVTGLAGCSLTDGQVRPPTPPPEFRSPPDEPRYAGPVQYPKETMEEDVLLKKAKSAANGPAPITNPRQGMGAGMGAMGR